MIESFPMPLAGARPASASGQRRADGGMFDAGGWRIGFNAQSDRGQTARRDTAACCSMLRVSTSCNYLLHSQAVETARRIVPIRRS